MRCPSAPSNAHRDSPSTESIGRLAGSSASPPHRKKCPYPNALRPRRGARTPKNRDKKKARKGARMIKSTWRTKKLEVRIGASLAAVALVMTALLASSPPASSTTRTKATGGSFLNIIADPAGPFADGFNPFSLSNSAYLQGATGMIYEPLMQFNLLKVGQIYPWLATSWSWANGGTELILHARPRVKWQDGKPVSAADVAYTFNLIKKFPALDGNGVTFTSASAPSSSEVILRFSSAAFTQLFDISQVLIVPEHIWSKIPNPVTNADDNPVGTGPYTVGSFSAQEFTFLANPHYWQKGLPKIAKLNFLAYASNPSA